MLGPNYISGSNFLNYSFPVHQKSVKVPLGVVKMKKREMGQDTEVASNIQISYGVDRPSTLFTGHRWEKEQLLYSGQRIFRERSEQVKK